MADDALLTPAEVCGLLRITDRTLWRWQAKGQVRPIRLPGNRRRFSRSEVERLLSERVA